mmetsp:Transcript_71244/g.204368  ORF Transcript_71244/g.204368 Transcript_71244/m.204368 type:complete len:125 (-) Transcript_71244:144-518(-)|eukprot:CAMPEP_0177165092 /NCGR_PEP_ID=MMETSP0367-20130122/7310_1 /TAXON_ID=447022 ORGANISM="Scrippsiella hangoei-like, Strain SHHI-4" /NCGR_SAMPLE_ID=MMETSP0367 /ASSEMBLY_ACC=CAM_ASM_000362 /LENGTH=124 /DNA_ID=CAMNT_0018611059 /DNA_START=78 /DNA_END=452 /DNA_ORIENTATION=-
MWSIIAFGIAPAGMVVWALLMSGFKPLQNISRAVLNVSIAIGTLKLTLPMFIALFSLIVWVFESYKVFGASDDKLAQTVNPDRFHASKWRSERNWWILNFNLVLWLTNWRVSHLFTAKEKDKTK